MQGLPLMMLMNNANPSIWNYSSQSNANRSSLSKTSSPSNANRYPAAQSVFISSNLSSATKTINADHFDPQEDAVNPYRPHKHRIISSSMRNTPLSQSYKTQVPACALPFQQLSQKSFPSEQFDQERGGDNEEALETQQQQFSCSGDTHNLGQFRFQDSLTSSTANSSLCNPSPQNINKREKIKRTIDCSNIKDTIDNNNQQQNQVLTETYPILSFKFLSRQSTHLGNSLQKSRIEPSQNIIINNPIHNENNNYQQVHNASSTNTSQVNCIPLVITGEQLQMINSHSRNAQQEQIKMTVIPWSQNKNQHYRRHRYQNRNLKYNNNNMNSNQNEERYQDQGNGELTQNLQNKISHQAFWDGNKQNNSNSKLAEKCQQYQKEGEEQREEEKEEEEEEKICENKKQSFSGSIVASKGITYESGFKENMKQHQELFSHRNNRRRRYQEFQANKGNIVGRQEQFDLQQQKKNRLFDDVDPQQGINHTHQDNIRLSLNNNISHGHGRQSLKRPSYNSRRNTRPRLLNLQKNNDLDIEESFKELEKKVEIQVQDIMQIRDLKECNEEQQLKSYQIEDMSEVDDNKNNNNNNSNDIKKDTSCSELERCNLDQEDESQLMQMLLECTNIEKDDFQERQLFQEYYACSQSECDLPQGNNNVVKDDNQIQGDIDGMFKEIEEVFSEQEEEDVDDDNQIQGDIDDMFREIEDVYANLRQDIIQTERRNGMQNDEGDEGEECCCCCCNNSSNNEIQMQYDSSSYVFNCCCDDDEEEEEEEKEECQGDHRLSYGCFCEQNDMDKKQKEYLEGQYYINNREQNDDDDDDDDYNLHQQQQQQQYSQMNNDDNGQGEYERLNLLRYIKNDSNQKQLVNIDLNQGISSKLDQSSFHSESDHNISESQEDNHNDDDISNRQKHGCHMKKNADNYNCELNQDNEQSMNGSVNNIRIDQSDQFNINPISFNDSDKQLSQQSKEHDDQQNSDNNDDSRLKYDYYSSNELLHHNFEQSQSLPQLVPLRSCRSNPISISTNLFDLSNCSDINDNDDNYHGDNQSVSNENDGHGDDENDESHNDEDDDIQVQEQSELAIPEMNESNLSWFYRINFNNHDEDEINSQGQNHSEENEDQGEPINDIEDGEEEQNNSQSYQFEEDVPHPYILDYLQSSDRLVQLNAQLALDLLEFNLEVQPPELMHGYFQNPPLMEQQFFNAPLMPLEEQIENIKTTFFDPNHPHKTCAICISDFNVQEHLKELPCTHHFHVECIDDWLRIKPSCPLCRQNFLQQEEEMYEQGEEEMYEDGEEEFFEDGEEEMQEDGEEETEEEEEEDDDGDEEEEEVEQEEQLQYFYE